MSAFRSKRAAPSSSGADVQAPTPEVGATSNGWFAEMAAKFNAMEQQPKERSTVDVLGTLLGATSTASSTASDVAESRGMAAPRGLGPLGSLGGLVSKGLGLGDAIHKGDEAKIVEGSLGAADGVAKFSKMDRASGILGPIAGMMGAVNALGGVFDEEKASGERVRDGFDFAGSYASLLGEMGGGLGAGALTAEVGALSGFAPIMAATGLVLGSGVMGSKVGSLMAEAGDSDWARRSNLGGTDASGNKRTLGDLATDVAVDAKEGVDSAGDWVEDGISGHGAWWADLADDKLGGGGGAIRAVADTVGDVADDGIDIAGEIVGGGIALGAGTAAGLVDFGTAAGNWIESREPTERERREMQRNSLSYRIGNGLGLVDDLPTDDEVDAKVCADLQLASDKGQTFLGRDPLSYYKPCSEGQDK